MSVAFPHLFCLMSHPFIDHALINGLGGEIASEAMAQNVPSPKNCPLAASECSVEMVMYLTARDGRGLATVCAASRHVYLLAEKEWPARVSRHPVLQSSHYQRGQRYSACRSSPFGTFLLMKWRRCMATVSREFASMAPLPCVSR